MAVALPTRIRVAVKFDSRLSLGSSVAGIILVFQPSRINIILTEAFLENLFGELDFIFTFSFTFTFNASLNCVFRLKFGLDFAANQPLWSDLRQFRVHVI